MAEKLKKFAVPKKAITEKGLKKLIKDAAKGHPSVGDWARENGITPQAISAFFRKTQGAGLKIPEVLGYRPQVIYMPLNEPLIQGLPAPRRVAKKPTSKADHTKTPIERKGRVSQEEIEKKLKKALKKRNKGNR